MHINSYKYEEIVIAGGGLIGLCSAFILGKLDFNITLIDQNILDSQKNINSDTRTIAISYGTKELLETHNIWHNIVPFVEPINHIKVFNRKPRSRISFNNSDKTEPMGYIIEHSAFKKKLIDSIQSNKKIKIFQGHKILNVKQDDEYVYLLSEKNIKLCSKLLIAADGKNSFIKSKFNFQHYDFDYNQSSLAINFQHQHSHQNTAYEIFLPNGPLATLPMKSKFNNIYRSSLIWSENKQNANRLLNINKKYLLDIIEEKVSPYLGKVIKLDSVKAFPLTSHVCRNFCDGRVVLVGDSAHSLHPIAGQGWNLGMRDVKHLTHILESYKNIGIETGNQEVLNIYNKERLSDVFSMFFITHGLNKIFSTESETINKIISLGFNYIDNNKKITNKLVNYAMGINL